MAITYSPLQQWQWGATSNRIGLQHDLGTAQNDWEKGTAKLGYQWNVDDAVRQFARQRAGLPGQFNRRGMAESGMWGRALTDFESDRARNLSRMYGSLQNKLSGFTINQDALDRIRKQAYADLDAQKEAVRQEKLLALQG